MMRAGKLTPRQRRRAAKKSTAAAERRKHNYIDQLIEARAHRAARRTMISAMRDARKKLVS